MQNNTLNRNGAKDMEECVDCRPEDMGKTTGEANSLTLLSLSFSSRENTDDGSGDPTK